MVVTSGRSHRHVNAVADRLLRDLKDAGFGTPKVEGMPACDWVLVDTGDVIEFHSEKIERLQEEIARELGYEIVHHRLELYGRKKKPSRRPR